MRHIYLLLLLTTLLVYSCKTATKAFEKGDYDDAVTLAVKRLQKSGNDEEAKGILRTAYAQLVQTHEAVISNLAASSSDEKYERMYNEYRKLQNLYEAVNRSPVAMDVVHAADYSSYVQTYREKTGEVYFDRGLSLMEKGDRSSFRQAYEMLKTAYRYKSDSEVKQKMDEAREAATIKVLLVNNDTYAGGLYNDGYNNRYNNGYNSGYYNSSYEITNFQQELIRNLRYQGSNDFVQFLTESDIRGSRVEPDEIVELRLNRIDMGRSWDENSYRDVSSRVVVRQVVYKPDSIVNEYANVYARVNIVRRHYISDGDLTMTARDAKGNYLWSDVVRGEHQFVTEMATYTGDERALSASDKAMINNSRNNGYNQVRREDILKEVLRQIECQAADRFRSYYNRY